MRWATGVRRDGDVTEQIATRTGPTSRTPRDPSETSGLDGVWRWAAGVAVAAVSVWVLLSTGVNADEVLRYSAYWLLGVILPGVVVHRLLRGQRAALIEDLGLGAATGIALELLAGVILGIIGADGLVRWWSLLVYASLLLPRVRSAVRTRPWERRESPGQAWALAAVSAFAVLRLLPFFRGAPLPPQDSTLNIDPWWHLSLTAEMLKPGTPQIPHVAGEPLVYHWFSHLHMAVAGDASSVDLPTVVLRLWIVPVALATVAVIVALARQVSGTTWSGPFAAWLTLLAVEGGLLWSAGTIPARVVFFMSPSQTLTNLLVVAAAIGLVEAVRRPVTARAGVWIVLLVFACTGAKPTALTALLGGTLLAWLASTVVSRRLDRRLLGLSLGLGLVLVFVMPLTSGSLSGKMTLFASLESLAPYAQISGGDGLLATSRGLLLDSLDDPFAWLVGALTLGRLVVGHATTFLGMAGLVHPAMRRDAVAWWLSGAFLSGWAAFLLVDHPSRSQFYFLSTTFVFGAVLTAWFVAVLTPTGKVGRRTAVLGLASGAIIAWLARGTAGWAADPNPVGPLDSVWVPVLVASAGLAALGSILWWRHRRSLTLPALAVVAFAVIGLAIPGAIERAANTAGLVLRPPANAVDSESIDFLTQAEQEAALWLKAASDPLDVVATNAHCRPGQPFFEYCDARGFWVSALSERRVFLEGWGYTPEASAAWGVGGRPTAQQPSPWPDRLELSQQVFTAPTQDVIDALRDRGVTWLVGVRGAGPVSSDVEELATKEFDNGDVAVFRIGETERPEAPG